MGFIDSRLQKVMQITQPGTRLPIIVETIKIPTQSDVQEIGQFVEVKRVSNYVNQVYGYADSYGIQNVASISFVSRVVYDEPVSKFQYVNLPSVTFSKTDIHIPISDSAQFIGATELHDIGIKGKGIKVAVVDTGVNKYHPMLDGAVIKQINIAGDNGAEFADVQDGQGHGTHVATTVAGRDMIIHSKLLEKDIRLHGVASEANLIGIKVLDDEGSGQTSWVMEGIEAAVKEGADIVNLSLGSMWDGAGMSPDSKLINELTFKHNILFSVAAGNNFANFTIGSPGGAVGSITVASNSIKLPVAGAVSTFSSKGATTDGRIKPDISAPGGNLLNVKEAIYAGTSGAIAEEAGEQYAGLLGTSMATPHISGALALLLQAGMKRDRFYIEDLLAYSSKYHHIKDIYTGWGMIDVKKAYDTIIKKESLVPVSAVMMVANEVMKPIATLIPKQEESINAKVVRLPYLR